MLRPQSVIQTASEYVGTLTDILVATVQDRLVTPAVLADPSQSLDDTQANLFALNVLVHGNVLNMTHAPESAQELPLDEDTSDTNDLI